MPCTTEDKQMDKTKKKSVKRYVLWGVMALVVVGLAVMPLMARQQQTEDGPTASILSATPRSAPSAVRFTAAVRWKPVTRRISAFPEM